jgi:hypothetical protein
MKRGKGGYNIEDDRGERHISIVGQMVDVVFLEFRDRSFFI